MLLSWMQRYILASLLSLPSFSRWLDLKVFSFLSLIHLMFFSMLDSINLSDLIESLPLTRLLTYMIDQRPSALCCLLMLTTNSCSASSTLEVVTLGSRTSDPLLETPLLIFYHFYPDELNAASFSQCPVIEIFFSNTCKQNLLPCTSRFSYIV